MKAVLDFVIIFFFTKRFYMHKRNKRHKNTTKQEHKGHTKAQKRK